MLSPLQATESPWVVRDGAWISLDGRVQSVESGGFSFNYGKGEIFVEMDGYDFATGMFEFDAGDSVSVTGRVDADGGIRTIEASEVRVKKTRQLVTANPDDEEEVLRELRHARRSGQQKMISGEVLMVAGRVMTVQIGVDDFIDVSTVALSRSSFSQRGELPYRQGDMVLVSGVMAGGYPGEETFIATGIDRMRGSGIAARGK